MPVSAVYKLEPSRPDAAPVTAQVDYGRQVTLYFGRHGTLCELWDGDEPALIDAVSRPTTRHIEAADSCRSARAA